MPKTDLNEIFPIVDDEGRRIGEASRATCHDGRSMLLHPVVHLHIITPDGSAILLQQRAMTKDIQPGRWDTAVGGHVDLEESIHDALIREAREELGIDASQARRLTTYKWASSRERELVNIHILIASPDELTLTPDPDEVSATRFWTLDEIAEARGKGVLTSNFEQEFDRILPLIREPARWTK